MEIFALVRFLELNNILERHKDRLWWTRRLYCLERAGGVLAWTLYHGNPPPFNDGLPILYRPHSCLGADLIYDHIEFERACKKIETKEEKVAP